MGYSIRVRNTDTLARLATSVHVIRPAANTSGTHFRRTAAARLTKVTCATLITNSFAFSSRFCNPHTPSNALFCANRAIVNVHEF